MPAFYLSCKSVHSQTDGLLMAYVPKTAQMCAQGALMLAAAIDDAELIEMLVAAGAEVKGASHDSPCDAD